MEVVVNRMKDLFDGIYNGKTVLVTGHTGFKGAWLSFTLNALGAKVVGFSLEPHTTPNLFDLLDLENRMTSLIGDVREAQALRDLLETHQPEIVFHLAAQALVRPSYQAPVETFDTNVMGVVNLLEAVRHKPSVKAVVNVTSDKCYENRETDYAYVEHDAIGGYDPYSASKGMAELATASFRHSFFNPIQYGKTHQTLIATVRAGNVIGGGDWSLDRLVPDCIRALNAGETIVLRHPQAVRPWQFVLEPLLGYLSVGHRLLKGDARFAEAWNFGPYQDGVGTVETVVQNVIDSWGAGAYAVEAGEHPHEATLLQLNIDKALTHLDWKPQYPLKQAIHESVAWYKAFYAGENMIDFSLQQLERYTKLYKP
jgi:CDP-glucose 4,6-dehydratase